MGCGTGDGPGVGEGLGAGTGFLSAIFDLLAKSFTLTYLL